MLVHIVTGLLLFCMTQAVCERIYERMIVTCVRFANVCM